MKVCLMFLLLVGTSAITWAQSRIVAQISNVRNDKGVCQVCLYNNATSFSGDGGTPVQCVQSPVKNGTSEALFVNVLPGTYAIMVFHDANSNKKLDQNFIGIPKEGYGASRNKLPFASAPSFNDNKFTITDKTTTTLRIRLRNL
jgi:uncharacterized protein (DUF2141 family)